MPAVAIREKTTLSDEDLLEWAHDVLERAQHIHLYGVVAFHFERGRITRAKTESSEVPENSR
jgi:hypothetical protein